MPCGPCCSTGEWATLGLERGVLMSCSGFMAIYHGQAEMDCAVSVLAATGIEDSCYWCHLGQWA